jgi:hypothetical protein
LISTNFENILKPKLSLLDDFEKVTLGSPQKKSGSGIFGFGLNSPKSNEETSQLAQSRPLFQGNSHGFINNSNNNNNHNNNHNNNGFRQIQQQQQILSPFLQPQFQHRSNFNQYSSNSPFQSHPQMNSTPTRPKVGKNIFFSDENNTSPNGSPSNSHQHSPSASAFSSFSSFNSSLNSSPNSFSSMSAQQSTNNISFNNSPFIWIALLIIILIVVSLFF